MRRIHLFAAVSIVIVASIFVPNIPLAANFVSLSAPIVQAPAGENKVRRVPVNSQAIAKLPKDKNYVVDVTQRGVTYEFDNKTSQLDLSRVFVRTGKGAVAIASFLEQTFPKEKLAAFKLSSQSFSVGTRPPGNVVTPPSAILNFGCDKTICSCSGKKDCTDMIFNTSLCGGIIICNVQSNGQKFCICGRAA